MRKSAHQSTRQYARIVDSWVEQRALDRADYGTHTLRRTNATLIYRRTKNFRAVQLLLGHAKLESAVRCFGIEVNDALGRVTDGPRAEVQLVETASQKRSFEISSRKARTFESTQEEIPSIQLLG
jgi:hypothetical protein